MTINLKINGLNFEELLEDDYFQTLFWNYIVLPEVEVRRTGTGKNVVLPD